MGMSMEQARKILVDKMKREGTYDSTVAELQSLIDGASQNYAEVPGMGRVSAWGLAVDMADNDFNVSEIGRALVRTHGVSISDSLVLGANAIGRKMEEAEEA